MSNLKLDFMVHGSLPIIQKQVEFLDNLRKTKYETLQQELPTFDFKALLNQVKRERRKRQFDEKWKHFLKKKTQLQDIPRNLENDEVDNINIILRNSNKGAASPMDSALHGMDSAENSLYCDCPAAGRPIEYKDGHELNPSANHALTPCNLSDNLQDSSFEENEETSYTTDDIKTDEFRECDGSQFGVSLHDSTYTQKHERAGLKIIDLLTNIKDLISKNCSHFFCHEDIGKIKRRTLQFAMLFKRNYSYRIAQQLSDLRNAPLHCDIGSRRKAMIKVLSVCNKTILALQAFQKQLEMGIAIVNIKDTISEFMLYIWELQSLSIFTCENIEKHRIEEIILKIIDDLKGIKDTDEVPKPLLINGKKEENQRKPPLWKRKSTALARTKFGPPMQFRSKRSNLVSKQKQNKIDSTNLSKIYSLSDVGESTIRSSGNISNHGIISKNAVQTNQSDKIFSDAPLKNKVMSPPRGNKSESTCQKIGDEYLNGNLPRDGFPEEPLSKIIAKRIQEVPGVDEELRKVEDARIKMMSVLLNIKNGILKNMNNLLSPGDEFERVKHRTLEFVARFKRNYFYRMKCQVNELRSLDPNPLKMNQKSKVLLVAQKLAAAHHSACQAFQIIEKQLQTISLIGLTQDLLSSYYGFMYELTFILKPFYGYLKSQKLDDVEQLVLETVKILHSTKNQEPKPAKTCINTKKTIAPKSKVCKNVWKKPRKKFLLGETNKDKKNLVIKERPTIPNPVPMQVKSPETQSDILLEEPKTMVEMLADHNLDEVSEEESGHYSKEDADLENPELLVLKQQNHSHGEHKLNMPRNIQLLVVKRPESKPVQDEKKRNKKIKGYCCPILDNVIETRKEIIESKKTSAFYKKSLQSVKSMANKLIDETLHGAVETIIKQIQAGDFYISLESIIEDA